MFGLDSDQTLIRLAATSEAYSSDNYGVPLSAAEEAELQRRVQVEQDAQSAAEYGSSQPTWAGYYFDQLSRGRPVFLFTGSTAEMTKDIARLLPPGSDFLVRRVERTMSELIATQEAIIAAYPAIRGAGIHITSTGLDLIENTVIVGIDGLTDAAADQIADRFGSFIRFKDSPPAQSDACPDTNCRPIKGGIKMVGADAFTCTAGFVVRRVLNGARLSVLTAGHCLWVQNPANPINLAWYHQTSSGANDRFGDSKYHTFTNLSLGDVGIIEIDDSEAPSSANKMYINNGSTGSVYTITNYIYDSNQTTGSQACAYGYNSNDSYCGMITDPNETKESCADPNPGAEVCYDIRNTKVYNYNLIPGDSGGPIYQVATSTTRYAMGTHVHSVEGNTVPIIGQSGWYTPYGSGQTAYVLASPGDNYSICVTAAC